MSAPKLSRASLGTVGLEHVKTRLEWNRPLRQALRGRLQVPGETWTWALLGSNFTLRDLQDGDPSDGVTEPAHTSLMTDFILEYLVQPGGLAIIEDDASGPNAPWLTNEPLLPTTLPRLGVDDNLYWYATEPDREAVQDLMRWGFSLFKTMVLARPTRRWPPAHAVAEDIEGLAKTADHIVVDAFDFDGFVVWTAS